MSKKFTTTQMVQMYEDAVKQMHEHLDWLKEVATEQLKKDVLGMNWYDASKRYLSFKEKTQWAEEILANYKRVEHVENMMQRLVMVQMSTYTALDDIKGECDHLDEENYTEEVNHLEETLCTAENYIETLSQVVDSCFAEIRVAERMMMN